MSVDVKQREWIWEFFLKNCTDARMIQELLSAFPFPEENLDLKRMLLLRSISWQVSAGMIDEFTLETLQVLGEYGSVSAVTRRERLAANLSCQEVADRRKVAADESNDGEATNSSTPQVDGSLPPQNLEQCRECSTDAIPAKRVVGLRDGMKGKALSKSVGGGGDPVLGNLSKGNMEMGYADNARTSSNVTGDPSGNRFLSPDQKRKHCELELAVMLELAVRHLRADSLDRRSFESVVKKFWEDSSDDSEGWHGAGVPGIARVREQIKSELRMVQTNPELLDDFVQKYTKARVENLLKIYLEKAWASAGQTFLEKVSTDVINGKYKPVNCNGQRSRKAGSLLGDGDATQPSSGNVDTSEKPWIRASRGKYSRSREKFQKNFAIWDLDDGDPADGAIAKLPTDERARDGEVQKAENVGGGSSQRDRDHGNRDGVNLKNQTLDGGEIGPSLSIEGGFEISARSVGFDGSVARVLQFGEPSGRQSKDEQLFQEKEETEITDIEATEAEYLLHQKNDTGIASGGGGDENVTGGSPISCAPDVAKVPGDSNVVYLSEVREKSTTDDEKGTKELGSPKKMDLADAEPGSRRAVVNNENMVPQSSPKPTDSNRIVCFSPPPWAEGSPAVPVAEGVAPGASRKRRHESIPEETDAASRTEECSSAEAAAPTTCSTQSPDTGSTRRNLRRKQRVLDAVVQDPLPKILTSSRYKGSLLERNATARTVEWEDDDDIEYSPNSSPSASRHVRLPHTSKGRKISPLVGSKTSGIMNAKHARRKPRKWSENEVESLKKEVGKYGKGRWKLILEKNLETFQGRTEVDLKDKWRNLERFEGIRD